MSRVPDSTLSTNVSNSTSFRRFDIIPMSKKNFAFLIFERIVEHDFVVTPNPGWLRSVDINTFYILSF